MVWSQSPVTKKTKTAHKQWTYPRIWLKIFLKNGSFKWEVKMWKVERSRGLTRALSVFTTQRRPSQNKCQGQCEEFLSPVTYWSLSNRVLNRDPRLPAMPSLSGMLPFVLRTSNVHVMSFFFSFFFYLIAGTSSQWEFLQTPTCW